MKIWIYWYNLTFLQEFILIPISVPWNVLRYLHNWAETTRIFVMTSRCFEHCVLKWIHRSIFVDVHALEYYWGINVSMMLVVLIVYGESSLVVLILVWWKFTGSVDSVWWKFTGSFDIGMVTCRRRSLFPRNKFTRQSVMFF